MQVLKEIRIFSGTLFVGFMLCLWFGFWPGPILTLICANNRDWLQAFDFELPIVGIDTLAVDHHGKIYCGSTFFSRIQVYSSRGEYLRGIFVPCEKEFRLSVDQKDQPVITTRFDNRYVFDSSGKILSKTKEPEQFTQTDSTAAHYRTKDGDVYKADDPLLLGRVFWHIRRVKPDGTIETPVSFPASSYLYLLPMILAFYETYFRPSKIAKRNSLQSSEKQNKPNSISTIGWKDSPSKNSIDFSKAKFVSHNCCLGAGSDVRRTNRGVLVGTDEAIFHQPYDFPDLEMRVFLWEIASVQKNGFSFVNPLVFPGLESHYKIKMSDKTTLQLILFSESKEFESVLSEGSVKFL